MPNVITGLVYRSIHTKLENEGQLIEVLDDLKKNYESLSGFEIESSGETISNFKDFLNAVLDKNYVNLTGSGNALGLIVENATIQYNLSELKFLTWNWNKLRDGSCPACTKSQDKLLQYGLTTYDCNVMDATKRKPVCPQYDAKIKNSQGGTARTLNEIINDYLQQ